MIVIALAVVAFLAVSLVLARWLTVESVERNAVTALLRDQVRGDAAAMLARLEGCAGRPACAATVRRDAATLRAPRDPKLEIVAYESATGYAAGAARGPTRVVWRVSGRLPTVQCVGVVRAGNVLSGLSVSLTALSEPIRRTAGC
jgi:hypothetical protein